MIEKGRKSDWPTMHMDMQGQYVNRCAPYVFQALARLSHVQKSTAGACKHFCNLLLYRLYGRRRMRHARSRAAILLNLHGMPRLSMVNGFLQRSRGFCNPVKSSAGIFPPARNFPNITFVHSFDLKFFRRKKTQVCMRMDGYGDMAPSFIKKQFGSLV